ncbi:MAG: ABC transporter ATP-binding protein [Burkholderiaceae bacterium]
MTPAIEVEHLTKEYQLGALQGLKQSVLNAGARLLGRPVEPRPLFKALDDVSFSIEQGEVVGIIGHNGAGKSTLLKMLARISTPTRGSVRVHGRIAPLIEVGAGFVPDFTGRENVYLNGSILGMSRKEIDRKFDEIVDFAEMAEFIDTPVKRYSSGMQVKLAFAVATSIESEILIVDEVLAVGDLAFQRKCFDRMEQLIKREQRTVLLVSHNIRQVERLCSRVIVMDHGRMAMDGAPQQACNFFYQQSDQKITENIAKSARERGASSETSGDLTLLNVLLLGADDQPTEVVVYSQPCTLRLTFKARLPLERIALGIGVHTPDLLYVANADSILSHGRPISVDEGEFTIAYRLTQFPLFPGAYAFRVGVAFESTDQQLYYGENLCHFQVVAGHVSRSRLSGQGFISLDGAWHIEKASRVE